MEHYDASHHDELNDPHPDEDDIFITSAGRLGCLTEVHCGKVLIYSGADHEAAMKALREYTTAQCFWPTAWSISDHGNLSIVQY